MKKGKILSLLELPLSLTEVVIRSCVERMKQELTQHLVPRERLTRSADNMISGFTS